MPKEEIVLHGRYFLRSASRQVQRKDPGARFPSHSKLHNVDPKKEGKRSLTIGARKRRLKELTQQMEEGTMAEESNQKSFEAVQKLQDDAEKLRQQLDEMAREKSSLEKSLREKERKVREQRYKLRLFKGHLDLIASTLEDDDPGKRLIMNLLEEIPD